MRGDHQNNTPKRDWLVRTYGSGLFKRNATYICFFPQISFFFFFGNHHRIRVVRRPRAPCAIPTGLHSTAVSFPLHNDAPLILFRARGLFSSCWMQSSILNPQSSYAGLVYQELIALPTPPSFNAGGPPNPLPTCVCARVSRPLGRTASMVFELRAGSASPWTASVQDCQTLWCASPLLLSGLQR